MALLEDAEEILATEDRRYEIVSVPEWNGEIRIRSLTGAERDDFEARSLKGKGPDATVNLRNVRARLVALCAVKKDDTLLFGPSQVMKLGQKNAAAISRLYDAASKLCGLTDEDVKELTEDFDETQEEASVSV